ncbi:hypothetical protein F0D05_14720 [Salmonella enterica]|nr:hypothetical protein [Salmonella enterica subsp. enterica serovar Kentucky]
MSTSRNLRHERINGLLSKVKSTKCQQSGKTRCPRWKALLIGLLLTLTAITSGCASESNQPVEQSKLTVDASLMATPNLTKEMLSVLSPSD